MTSVIDASYRIGASAHDLAGAGVRTVFRYYTRDSAPSAEKRLHPAEAQQLTAAGLRIGVFYEGARGNQIDHFNAKNGLMDATFARTYANHTIGQPAGSAIYFAVDTDEEMPAALAERIIPYFESVSAAMSEVNGEPLYKVGVYGNGLVCETLLDRGLVTKTFVAQSTGWSHSAAFRRSGRWTVDQGYGAVIGGVKCDPDTVGSDPDIGDFMLHAPHQYWSELNNMANLEKSLANHLNSRLSQQMQSRHDAPRVARLIELGSTTEGLAAARTIAKASITGYPHNGCAVHLCALLQLAGIDVSMTTYAGCAASHLEQRGWGRIKVGNQQPGDVGVCIDTGGTEGADHVYLVIEALADNEMLIADNQNGSKNAPHRRFATAGHGKTLTDYFLRAG